MLKRSINLFELLDKKSFFLLGPRGIGKSFWIKKTLSELPRIDLLNSKTLMALSAQPNDLERFFPPDSKQVVIDEIQKLPELLNEVHRLIEEKGIHFLLTGSSTRKLQKEGNNLLGGRAWTQRMHPLTSREIPDFNLDRYLQFGGLPAIYLGSYPEEDLAAYVESYIKEEIIIEARIRNLTKFSRFLKTAALCNGQLVNYTQLGSDAEIPSSTIREYFYLLQDTLMGFLVEPWLESKKRKAIQTSKFYFFDPGVVHSIVGSHELDRESDRYGQFFEQFIAMELRAYLDYKRIKKQLLFWRSTAKDEVDFIIPDELAIEVKSTSKVTSRMLKGLQCIKEENKFKHYLLVSMDSTETFHDGIRCIPWQKFLKELWDGTYSR